MRILGQMNAYGVVDLVRRLEEEWLASELVKVMPPELFLRAYGNSKCQSDVQAWMEKEGYRVAIHPDGRNELRRGEEVLATFDPPLHMLDICLHDINSFAPFP